MLKLKGETYEEANKVAPRWDVYHLEREWHIWIVEGDKSIPKDPDKAFLGFCAHWFKTRGKA